VSHSQGMIYMENASSITVKDCALKAAGADKTTIPLFRANFVLQECDEFTETGSGQTEEKFRGKSFSAGIAAIWMEEANQNHTISVSGLNAAENPWAPAAALLVQSPSRLSRACLGKPWYHISTHIDLSYQKVNKTTRCCCCCCCLRSACACRVTGWRMWLALASMRTVSGRVIGATRRQRLPMLTAVRKRMRLFAPFDSSVTTENDHFTKTGSGQT
jgi:hypothetical protein